MLRGKLQENEQVRRIMNCMQDTQRRAVARLQLISEHHPHSCEWNDHESHSSGHSSLIQHCGYLWALPVGPYFTSFHQGRAKDFRLAKDFCFDWQKGGYKDRRCALLGKSFHTSQISSKEENTNSSSLSQKLYKSTQQNQRRLGTHLVQGKGYNEIKNIQVSKKKRPSATFSTSFHCYPTYKVKVNQTEKSER